MATTPPVNPSMGTYANAAGSVVQAAGQIYSAIQAQALGRYNEAAAKANAQADAYRLEIEAAQQERLALIAEQEQALVAEAAAFREARMQEQFARLEGAARARIGASGVAFAGSPLYVMEESARQSQMALLVSQYETRLQQRALQEAKTQHLYAAELARYGMGERLRVGGQQATLAGFTAGNQASANLLGAAGSLAEGAGRFNYLYSRDQARASGLYGAGTQ
jgi:hypothetical protein